MKKEIPAYESLRGCNPIPGMTIRRASFLKA
jgi:hypothetical protein